MYHKIQQAAPSLLCGMKLQIRTFFTISQFLTFFSHKNTQDVQTPHTKLPAETSAERIILCRRFSQQIWRRSMQKQQKIIMSFCPTFISDESRFQTKDSSVFETEVKPSVDVLLPHSYLFSPQSLYRWHAEPWFFVSTEFRIDRVCVPEETSGPLGGRATAPLTTCQSSAFAPFLMWKHEIFLHFWCHPSVCFQLCWHQPNRKNWGFNTFNDISLKK